MQFTEQQISIVARSLSDSAALACGVNKDDTWKIYSEQYIEEATSALEKLSAAAPQVVADERKGSPYPEYDRGFSNGWDACAKRAAAPVQAQDPVLLQWRWRDTHPNTVTTGQFSEWETCDKTKYDEIVYYRDNGYPHYEVRKLFTHSAAVRPVPDDWTLMPNKLTQKMVSVLEFGRNQPAHNTYLNLRTAAPSSPVQPVAVPDGHEKLIKALKDIAEACNCCGDRSDLSEIANDALGDYELSHEAQFEMMNHRLKKEFAAPAAQGDTLIESNLREIIAKTSDDYARYVAQTTLAAIAAKAAS